MWCGTVAPMAKDFIATARWGWEIDGSRSSICRRPGISRWPNEDGTSVIVYNGEIYNFKELRPELEARGHRFRLADRHRGRAARVRGMGRGRV